ncbi:MAG: hypothetical protein JOY91_04015 [Sinobacteraceae bacterium]|nr:hypothetical protein [Nevskiaceae bacterium]
MTPPLEREAQMTVEKLESDSIFVSPTQALTMNAAARSRGPLEVLGSSGNFGKRVY